MKRACVCRKIAILERMATLTVHQANAITTCNGRFEFVKHLGQGGFGTVFLSRDQESGRKVAIKCIKSGATESILTISPSGRHVRLQQRSDLTDAKREIAMLLELYTTSPHSKVSLRLRIPECSEWKN